MTNTIFKYRINELLNKLPVTGYRKALRVIPVKLDISQKTFSNYRKIKIGDVQDIPHEKVALLEKLFDIQPGELQNYICFIEPLNAIDEGEVLQPARISAKL